MTPLRKFALFLLTLLLSGVGAIPAAAVDYTVTGTLTQDPTDPLQLERNGAAFEWGASATGTAISSTTTSTDSEATYNATMQFALDDEAPAVCMGSPTLTLVDSVSGDDTVSFDGCEVDFALTSSLTLPGELDGSFTIPGGNMATSAPADITSTSATGSLILRVFGPKNTFTFNFDLNGGSLEAGTAEPPAVTIMPSSVSLAAMLGSTTPEEQVVSFTASQAVSYSISTSGGSWLDVTPTAGNTSSTITVSADPSGLTVGVYNGSVMLSYGSQAQDSIPVMFEITSPPAVLSVDPSQLTFSHQIGTSAPAAQSVDVTGSEPLSYTVATSGGDWLSVSSMSGDTPGSFDVMIDPAGLTAGMYSGVVSVASVEAGKSTQMIPVTLNVTDAPTLSVDPSQLTFNHQIDGPPPVAQMVAVTGSAPLSYTVAASGEGWLSVGAMSGDTPGAFDVMVDPTGLTAGTHSGMVSVTSAGADNSPLMIPVTLNVSLAALVVTPTQLTFSHQIGTTVPPSQPIQVFSAVTTDFVVNTSGELWLSVTPETSTTPETLAVSVDPSGLAPGDYTGSLTIAPQPGGPPSQKVIDVSLTVTGPALTATPMQLAFSGQVGGATPDAQEVALSTPVPAGFTASVTEGAFLDVTPTNGTAPSSVSVAVNTDGLEPGSYNGVVTVTPDGGSPTLIDVLLTVSDSPSLSAAPDSLSFTYYVNGEMPSPAMVSLSATEAMDFAAAASGGDWLSVGSDGDMTPAGLTVMVDPMELDPGEYLGEITVTAEAANNSPVVIPVSLTVILAPLFSSENLLNAASFALGEGPASGGLGSVFGFFPGVADEGAADIPLPPEIQDVTIRMRPLTEALTEADEKGQDEQTSAPLLFVSDKQINFQIPWEIPPGLAEMIVTVDGADSEPVEVVLTEVNPGIFTFDFGPGRAVAFLPNGVVAQPVGSIPNVTSRPIRPGEVLVILATGLGPLTGPPLPSGDNSLDENGVYIRRDTVFAVRVLIGGQEALLSFSGSSPQFVGVNQVNVIVPEGVEPGAEVTLVLEVNGIQSRTDVTIAVDPAP